MAIIRPTLQGIFPKIDITRPFYGPVALGNMTQYTIGLFKNKEYLVVAIEGKGCYPFAHHAHWGYVADKLNLKYEADARNVADFINSQLGILTSDKEAQGYYYSECCSVFESDLSDELMNAIGDKEGFKKFLDESTY